MKTTCRISYVHSTCSTLLNYIPRKSRNLKITYQRVTESHQREKAFTLLGAGRLSILTTAIQPSEKARICKVLKAEVKINV